MGLHQIVKKFYIQLKIKNLLFCFLKNILEKTLGIFDDLRRKTNIKDYKKI